MNGQELILSKSSMDMWLTCHYQWYLRSVIRAPAPPNLEMAIGTAIHAGAEAHWLDGEPYAAALMAFEDAMGPERRKDRDTMVANYGVIQTLVGVYLDKIAPTFHPTIIERDFLIRVDGVLVSGRIDAADDASDEVHDTKTTSTPSKIRSEHHRLEMTTYWHGYKAITGRAPKRLVLDVIGRNKRWKQMEIEPDDREFADVVGLVASGIMAGNFEPTGALSNACARCPYFAKACAYGRVD